MTRPSVVALLGLLLIPSVISAQRLPAAVIPTHYDLAFVVDLTNERFSGTETIDVTIAEPAARIVLHAVDLEIRDVTITSGGSTQTARVTVAAESQTVTLTVGAPLERGPAAIHVRYRARLNQDLRGFYLSKTKLRKYAVTQFESTDARRAFLCFDEPAFKATFAVTLTIDRGDTAISNGRMLSDTPGPGLTQHTVKFATTPQMSSYLVAMAVGDFKCLTGAADAIPIRICATPDKVELGRLALESAEQVLRYYNGYYAITYPFAKLDVVAIPDFAAGAMENTAAIFYRETDLLADTRSASVATRKNIASVLAHEMAHQWFGDLVTMQWWDDLWLNEGFATWMANKPLAAMRADWNVTVDEADENRAALNLDSLASTRPIHADVSTPAQIDEAFDAIAYEKGAAVLRMVENYLGPEVFRTGVNAYLQAHAYKNAASEDFWKAIAATSGKPVERILPTFVNQAGVPLISVSSACTAGGTAVTLTQQRFRLRSVDDESGRWQLPVCLKSPSQAAPTCEVLTDVSQTFTLPGTCAPWILANAGARGYYRTSYSSALLRALSTHVESDLSAPERLTLLDDAWALVRAGRQSVSDYLTLAGGYDHERTSGVLQELTARLGFMRTYLVAEEGAPTFERFARGLLRPLFDEVGLSASASDSDERRALRGAVIAALGNVGNDPDVVAKARAALDRALAGGPALDATAAAAITRTAAAHGNAALFDALLAAAERSTSPEDRYRYLYALGDVTEPALIERGLQYALSPQLRSQDTALYLARFLANPAGRARAWAFVKDHWGALEPKITIALGDVTLVRALAGFCDAGARADLATFFREHPLPGATRTLDQTFEQIDTCIAVRTAQTPALAAWLAAR